MTTEPRILIVDDGVSETGDVLRAVLEPRGVAVDRATQDGDHLPRPTLLIIDDESPQAPAGDRWQGVPRVIIGTATIPAERVFAKPFHYADLVQAIEELIAA